MLFLGLVRGGRRRRRRRRKEEEGGGLRSRASRGGTGEFHWVLQKVEGPGRQRAAEHEKAFVEVQMIK